MKLFSVFPEPLTHFACKRHRIFVRQKPHYFLEPISVRLQKAPLPNVTPPASPPFAIVRALSGPHCSRGPSPRACADIWQPFARPEGQRPKPTQTAPAVPERRRDLSPCASVHRRTKAQGNGSRRLTQRTTTRTASTNDGQRNGKKVPNTLKARNKG